MTITDNVKIRNECSTIIVAKQVMPHFQTMKHEQPLIVISSSVKQNMLYYNYTLTSVF